MLAGIPLSQIEFGGRDSTRLLENACFGNKAVHEAFRKAVFSLSANAQV
jgi:hypothetical protein